MRRPGAAARRLGALSAAAVAATTVAACGGPAPGATPAPAIRVGSSTASFADGGGRLVVHRSPATLAVQDGRGATVLADGVVPTGAPVPVPPTADPQPPGTPNPAAVPSYEPLSFLVGGQVIDQYAGGLTGGDLRSAVFAGTEYAATRVLSARRRGTSLVVTLGTNDPTGRRLQLTVRSAASGRALALSVRAEPATGVVMMGDSFRSTPGEGFFGFGGLHDGLDQHGRLVDTWVAEENVAGSSGPGQGNTSTDLYPNGPTAAYDAQAGFVSSAGYGFLVTDPTLTRFRLDADRSDAWNVRTSGASFDAVIAPGGPTAAISALTAVDGREPAPPQWALGPQMDRLLGHAANATATYQAQLASDLAEIRRTHLPLTAYRIEGWGNPSGPNGGLSLPSATSPTVLASTIATLRRMGIHPLVYLRPWLTASGPAVARHLAATTASGAPALTTGTTGQPIALLDPTNPAAVRYWDSQVSRALDLGADGFMLDFGEQVLTSMHFANGETGATMHNRYPVLMARITRQAVDAWQRKHPARSVWFYVRSGFSGAPGSAAYEGGTFPGDEETSWSHADGLASLTSDMLNRAVLGAYGYGTDIGGYFDIWTPPTTATLFTRWAEWAALSPVFRLHGSALAGTHTPWSYGATTLRTYVALSALHLRAAPYIESLWRQADRTGIPPTRPLWMADPGSATARAADQEWMLGPDVLVAPVVTQGAVSRSVTFPPGCWVPQGRHLDGPASGSGATALGHRRATVVGGAVHGPTVRTVAAPLDVLPYWFRCGTHPF